MKTIESVVLDYISKNHIPGYYVQGNDITPKLLKKFKVHLDEGERPLLMLKHPSGLSDNASCKSSFTITTKCLHFMTPKKGLKFGYDVGSFEIQGLDSLNFGSKRVTLREQYIGHPLLKNGEELGLIQFNVTIKDDFKEIKGDFEKGSVKQYSDNIALNFILGLFDEFATEGIIKTPVEEKSWNEDDTPRSTFMKIVKVVWNIIGIFIK